MSAQGLLISLFRYKAWADEGLIAGLARLEEEAPDDEYYTAVSVLNHAHIVDRIFVANLQRVRHAYTKTETAEVPKLEDLSRAIRETDQWYVAYLERLDETELTEAIEFVFTDGTPGRMSREEMLGHIIAHAGYHRGEVGRILTQLTTSSPRDTFTGYLHEVEPARRGLPGEHRTTLPPVPAR
ncbi:damage-inducible protein DinB [Paraburkholderia acidicola]|uniref:Damage-inducible protein DinB n=1 Tax=Paraburkholderia acidicola TaxID=1912599 RepID=A0A2A4ET43_9BURK|nr:DinB family protein [Paraburkholderia acidicola]PCE24025.1 damage-inducible protein DinB [Paraburkholderia acidicola]